MLSDSQPIQLMPIKNAAALVALPPNVAFDPKAAADVSATAAVVSDMPLPYFLAIKNPPKGGLVFNHLYQNI